MMHQNAEHRGGKHQHFVQQFAECALQHAAHRMKMSCAAAQEILEPKMKVRKAVERLCSNPSKSGWMHPDGRADVESSDKLRDGTNNSGQPWPNESVNQIMFDKIIFCD